MTSALLKSCLHWCLHWLTAYTDCLHWRSHGKFKYIITWVHYKLPFFQFSVTKFNSGEHVLTNHALLVWLQHKMITPSHTSNSHLWVMTIWILLCVSSYLPRWNPLSDENMIKVFSKCFPLSNAWTTWSTRSSTDNKVRHLKTQC